MIKHNQTFYNHDFKVKNLFLSFKKDFSVLLYGDKYIFIINNEYYNFIVIFIVRRILKCQMIKKLR